MDWPRFNPPLLALIDGLVMPTQEEIEDVALKRLGRPANEADYLINFIQKSQKTVKSKFAMRKFHKSRARKSHSKHRQVPVQEDPAFDDPPRNIIYRMFDGSTEESMKCGEFQKFIKYSWLFQCFDEKRLGWINDVNFWSGMKNDVSPIVLNSREKGVVAQAGDWIGANTGM